MATETWLRHRVLESNGIRMHVAEAGDGPLVVLLHGFPESWYSWRHQLRALADAGYHAVAPDQRGYGRTDRPEQIDQYSMFHLVGDVIGLIDALGESQAVVAGHDWGARWRGTRRCFDRDRVRGVIGLSVPYRPRGGRPPISVYRTALGENFYQVYFQQPGVAEAALERDVRTTMRRVLYGASGDNPVVPDMMVRPGQGFFEEIDVLDHLPDWITEGDLDYYASEFERSGFVGGLNWYRNIDRNWELTSAWQAATVTPPALYVVGDRDVVYRFPGMQDLLPKLRDYVPNLKTQIVLENCGHWTQQERPVEVNLAMIDFLRALP